MIRFDRNIFGDLDAALAREWLETNGLGGFASSTIIGLNTRRYHGLLTAATTPPVGRLLLLAKLEETLIINGQRFELSANQYPGVIHPQGYRYLSQFRLDPFPIFTYEVAGVEMEKSVFMIHGENSTIIRYRLLSEPTESPLLELRPLIAFRDCHSTTHENDALNAEVRIEATRAAVTPYTSLPTLYMAHDADAIDTKGSWYRSFEYRVERERGLDWVEDLYNPCTFRFDLGRQSHATIIASTTPHDASHADELRRAEISRRSTIQATFAADDAFVATLVAAADQFIVARGEQQTVIAGYHWFSDWGRDTMVAIPGLTLTTGRVEMARSILLAFARYVDRGMLPNRFPDAGEQAEYNTVDATLWFFEAIRAFLHYSGDHQFVRTELYPVLNDIIAWHRRGTRYGIRVDGDGLLRAGEAGVQLTWMDAKVGDWVVTPRRGKPVEVQALWYNALCLMEHLAREFGDDGQAKQYDEMASLAHRSFNQSFWNDSADCLYDVVDGGTHDASLRPNQIFAVSLPHTMLCRDKSRRVVDLVQRFLLTPYGLRSLAPNDVRYCGDYAGDPGHRDGVYHQGPVWAWLMGPFITAYLKVNDHTAQTRQQVTAWLSGFHAHLLDAGLGQVSEIFDGDAPHHPRGCIAQAWSTAELLRATVEDVLGRKPPVAQ
jgi:predicted glycogen debranching enzyme